MENDNKFDNVIENIRNKTERYSLNKTIAIHFNWTLLCHTIQRVISVKIDEELRMIRGNLNDYE